MRSMLKIAKTGYLVLSALLILAGVGLAFFSDTFYPILTVLLGVLFLLAAIADKFRYLKVGVSVLLVFIGVKMLIHDFFEIDAVSSRLCAPKEAQLLNIILM